MTKRVKWEVDVEADTPEDASRQALAIQRKPDSTATVFDVTDESGKTVRVDLDADDASGACHQQISQPTGPPADLDGEIVGA